MGKALGEGRAWLAHQQACPGSGAPGSILCNRRGLASLLHDLCSSQYQPLPSILTRFKRPLAVPGRGLPGLLVCGGFCLTDLT